MKAKRKKIRLNLGCGGRPLPGFVNVDQDDLAALKRRYPGQKFPKGVVVRSYDIFALPYADGAVDEVRCDSLVEHLSFKEEPRFFNEVRRVLKPGGVFRFATPDFEATVRRWLKAKDDWRDFFRDDEAAIKSHHWFGVGSYSLNHRWGYLTASIFGSQNGEGQFHKNAYTAGKIRAMLKRLGFTAPKIRRFRWKGDRETMLEVVARKAAG
ncbi:MAG: methyltransferase domain-containing protein [Elusimicrobia bacterium]|nr:methyltransferase domain-containing protein [Elusimicrobiota bacterium]